MLQHTLGEAERHRIGDQQGQDGDRDAPLDQGDAHHRRQHADRTDQEADPAPAHEVGDDVEVTRDP